jgi:hypothetical protein
MKDGNVGTNGEFDHQFAVVGGVVIVLDQPLADFARCDADDWIGVGVVGGGAVEDIDADAAFFQVRCVTLEGLLHGVGEEGRVAFAVGKQRMDQQALKLTADRSGVNGRILLP